MAKKTATRSAASDDLSGRISGSGLIQPGAKAKQFDVDTPLDKVTRAAGKAVAAIKKATTKRGK